MTVYQSLVKQCVKTILWGVGVLLLSVVGIALAFRYFPNFWIVSGFALTIPLSLICALITIQRIRCPQCRKSVGSAAVYSAFFRVLAEPIQFCPHCVLNLRTSVADVPTIGLSRQNEPRPSPLELTLQQILYKKLRVGGIAGIGFIASFMIFGIYLGKNPISYSAQAISMVFGLLSGLFMVLASTCPKCGVNLYRTIPFASFLNSKSEMRYCPFCAFDLSAAAKEWNDKPLPPPLPDSAKFGKRKEW